VLRERLAAAQAALARTEIRAAVAGTILTRNAEPGDIVQPGTVLFEIAPRGPIEVLVPIDEKSFGAIELGQSARCVADAYRDEVFTARVTLIAPKVDPLRGTVDVRLTVDPVPAFLRQDMTVSVNIETARRALALTVPNDALIAEPDGSVAVLALRGRRTVRVPVEVGLKGLTMTEVTAGLAAGDLVLATPAVAAGQRVRSNMQPLPTGVERASSNAPAAGRD
jgi:HlyD family secretion protein